METGFHFRLSGGQLDLDALRQQLAANPSAFRHPHYPDEMYVIAPHPNTARMVQADLAKNPNVGLGGSALLTLYPQGVTAHLGLADRLALAEVEKLLLPVMRQHPGTIVNVEYGDDVTAKYQGHLEQLFH